MGGHDGVVGRPGTEGWSGDSGGSLVIDWVMLDVKDGSWCCV